DDVAEHARQLKLTVPVLKDPENRVADLLLVERTCEALLIDGQGRLRYRGAIDDQYGLGTRRDRPGRQYLTEAIEALLAGRTVTPETTPVVGCPIERVMPEKPRLARSRRGMTTTTASPDASARETASPSGSGADSRPVSYASDVATILQRRCVT